MSLHLEDSINLNVIRAGRVVETFEEKRPLRPASHGPCRLWPTVRGSRASVCDRDATPFVNPQRHILTSSSEDGSELRMLNAIQLDGYVRCGGCVVREHVPEITV